MNGRFGSFRYGNTLYGQRTPISRTTELAAEAAVRQQNIALELSSTTVVGQQDTLELSSTSLAQAEQQFLLATDGVVEALVTLDLTAAVQVLQTDELDLSGAGVVQAELTASLAASAVAQQTDQFDLAGGAVVQDTFWRNVAAQAVLALTRQEELAALALVARTTQATWVGDAVALATGALDLSCSLVLQQKNLGAAIPADALVRTGRYTDRVYREQRVFPVGSTVTFAISDSWVANATWTLWRDGALVMIGRAGEGLLFENVHHRREALRADIRMPLVPGEYVFTWNVQGTLLSERVRLV